MRYALDASVAFKWVVPEADSDKALRLRAEYAAGLHRLFAPDFFATEVAHALTRAERQRRVPVGEAEVLWADVMTTPPVFARSALLLARAVGISSRLRVGVY